MILILSLWLCSALFDHVHGQPYIVDQIPDSLTENANSVFWEKKTEIDVQSPASIRQKRRLVYTRMNKNAPGRQVPIGYNKFQRITHFEATIYDENGVEIRRLKKKNMTDHSHVSHHSLYEDDRYKLANVGHNVFPYTVAITYTVEYDGLLFFPDFHIQGFNESVIEANYTVHSPEEFQIFHAAHNIEIDADIRTEGQRKQYKWVVENRPAIERERMAPSSAYILPHVVVSPGQFEIEGYSGSMATWADFGKFMYQLNQGRDALSSTMKQEVRRLTKHASNDAQKIDKLYRFLQEHTRYVSVQVGVGGWQTFDAKYVENNQFGDCKALSNFMVAMLSEVGIQAHMTLIRNGDRDVIFDPSIANPAFNHMIVHVPSEDMWLECTSSRYPTGYVGVSNADREVLVVTSEGGVFTRTPVIGTNARRSKATVVVDVGGRAKVSGTSTYTNALHEKIRAYCALPKEDLEETFMENFELSSFDLETLVCEASKDEAFAEMRYVGNALRYGSKAGKRLFIPLNGVEPIGVALPKDAHREHDLDFGFPVELELRVTIQIPEGFQVESLPPASGVIERDFARFNFEIQQEGNTISYHRKLQHKGQVLPAAAYADIRAFYIEVSKIENSKIVLVKKKT